MVKAIGIASSPIQNYWKKNEPNIANLIGELI
jgi:hypothetical protein